MAQLPFDPNNLSIEDRRNYERIVARRKAKGAPFDGPYAALMNHPKLCALIEDVGFYLKFEGRLPRHIYQFTVLCVAQHTAATFEWTDHVEHCRAAGVPDEVIETLRTHGLQAAAYPPPYALVARILSAALDWKNIPQDAQSAAIAEYGMEGFVEIVVLAGFYEMFSTINQGFDVQPRANRPSP